MIKQSQTSSIQTVVISTSNSNYTKPDYPYLDAIGFTWTDPYRWAREVKYWAPDESST